MVLIRFGRHLLENKFSEYFLKDYLGGEGLEVVLFFDLLPLWKVWGGKVREGIDIR